jgi:hypothetical protein
MKRYLKFGLLVVGIGSIIYLLFATKSLRRYWLKQEAAQIIAKIEEYRRTHGRLPSNLEDIGVTENKIFYNKRGESNYVVSFGEELGESTGYRSMTKTWDR